MKQKETKKKKTYENMKHKSREERDRLHGNETDCRKRERLKYEKNAVKRCTIPAKRKKQPDAPGWHIPCLLYGQNINAKKYPVHLRKKENLFDSQRSKTSDWCASWSSAAGVGRELCGEVRSRRIL
ncbi:MAG: hypothetical protein ACLUD2_13260 [Clostridium sp.]